MDESQVAEPVTIETASKRRQSKALKLQTLVFEASPGKGASLDSGKAVAKRFADLAKLDRETFVVVTLDIKHRVIGSYIVSMGTLSSSLVHPREIMKAAVYDGAAAIIAIHNHPSGDPVPSSQDRDITRGLQAVCQVLGFKLLDHVVVATNGYASFEELGWL